MENAKKNCDVKKATLETAIGEAQKVLGEEVLNLESMQAAKSRLERCKARYFEVGDSLLDKMLKTGAEEIDMTEEETTQSTLFGKTEAILKKMEDKIQSLKFAPREDDDASIVSLTRSNHHHHRLPMLELPKFGGEARDWLAFWSAFQTVHEDDTITIAVKFQYLTNCMISGSVAQEIVSSYPSTPENYIKAIRSLEERFGRADMLVEVYVRDLIGLILENAQSKSSVSFSTHYVRLSTQLRALGSLGVTTEKCAAILLPMVESTLPEDVLVAWERSRPQIPVEKDKESEIYLDKLMEFLKSEVEGSERIRLARQPFQSSSSHSSRVRNNPRTAVATAASLIATEGSSKPSCVFCGRNHPSEACRKAASMSVEERRKIVNEKRRCFACLKPDHNYKKCKEFVKCDNCGKRHYAIVCPDKLDGKRKDSSVELCNQLHLPEVPLQTVILKIKSGSKYKIVRAMMDNGSQRSYILKSTARELALQNKGQRETTHLTFGGGKHKKTHYRYEIQLSSMESNYSRCFKVDDEDNICSHVPDVKPGSWITELKKKGVILCDEKYKNISSTVEVLLGNDVYGSLLTGEKIDFESGITALDTVFGWTLSGEMPEDDFALSCHVRDVSLQDLWSLDIIGIKEPLKDKTKNELQDAALEFFKKTVTQKEDGRYVVNLPWIEEHPPIPSYRGIAEKKLHSNKARLEKLGVLKAYHEVFKSWEEENVIERVSSGTGHYLSHHGVLKPDSQTTPVRPVFNASFKSKGSTSLNACLEVGPNMLEEIPAILTRFRMGPVGVTSDIRKAFLQIEVAEKDRDFVRCLWYKDDTFKEVQEFRHNRVVFGVSSSPFLLQATLDHHLSKAPKKLDNSAQLLKKSFYVDNCCASLPTMEDALKFKKEATKLLESAKMDLRCWEIAPSEEDKQVPVLGMSWGLQSDDISFDLSGTFKKLTEAPATKRRILSVAYSVFDPIGIACAFTIIPKILLQETCKLKVGWDNPLPEEMSNKFNQWTKQLTLLKKLKIPRCIAVNQERATWSLHIYTDASGSAYASCAFLRCGFSGNVSVQLIMARSRVAPIQDTTIPRLELLGCLCGIRLANKVKKNMEIPELPTTYWTDSTTALAWIKNDRNWGIFVAGRVKEIRSSSKIEEWRHVPGKQNPADIPSRGASVKTLLETPWWEGPHWLKQEEDSWPRSAEIENKEEILEELKKTIVSHVNTEQVEFLDMLNKWSDYHKIVRIIVYVLRWKNRAIRKTKKNRQKQKNSMITSEEFGNAERKLLKLVQSTNFTGVADPKLKNLGVFTDKEGIIRLRSRVSRGEVLEDSCSIVLPQKDAIVGKMIWKYHQVHCHVGVQTLQVILRERFWILHSRRTIQSTIRPCIKCRRFRAQPVKVPEGNLPKDRTVMGPAFDVTGVDMAGPLFTKGKKKVYIAIFTCATYRAVHLELCSSLTTEVFVAALRRFVARRGRPSTIYSDNGLNFVGCSSALKNVDWKMIVDYANVSQIRWKFNPPTASWWGGFWERMIGVVKQLLRSVLGSARVTNEELETLLCDVESVVNSRPLTYVSEDPDELNPLTPNTFILNKGMSYLPDVDAVEREQFQGRYRNLQHCRDELRNRFQKEYLALLVQHGKSPKSRKVKVGDVVLVGSDQRKRIDWPLGLVTEVIPGKDEQVRVARVKTANGIFLRPAQRLYLMEISDSNL